MSSSALAACRRRFRLRFRRRQRSRKVAHDLLRYPASPPSRTPPRGSLNRRQRGSIQGERYPPRDPLDRQPHQPHQCRRRYHAQLDSTLPSPKPSPEDDDAPPPSVRSRATVSSVPQADDKVRCRSFLFVVVLILFVFGLPAAAATGDPARRSPHAGLVQRIGRRRVQKHGRCMAIALRHHAADLIFTGGGLVVHDIHDSARGVVGCAVGPNLQHLCALEALAGTPAGGTINGRGRITLEDGKTLVLRDGHFELLTDEDVDGDARALGIRELETLVTTEIAVSRGKFKGLTAQLSGNNGKGQFYVLVNVDGAISTTRINNRSIGFSIGPDGLRRSPRLRAKQPDRNPEVALP
ncbi:hypothetical protein THAOC_24340, partial [Thalassiosira oceanica]